MSRKYAIGVDYGTESGRAVLVVLSDGAEIADHVTPYPHGVIDERLPGTGLSWRMTGLCSILAIIWMCWSNLFRL